MSGAVSKQRSARLIDAFEQQHVLVGGARGHILLARARRSPRTLPVVRPLDDAAFVESAVIPVSDKQAILSHRSSLLFFVD